jgi:thiosulfate dehydrogenase [quinone] large subunit
MAAAVAVARSLQVGGAEMGSRKNVLVGVLRIAMGWMFLWPFLDKLFGLGFSTAPENAWLAGGSPTAGYLTHATAGPLAEFFQSLAGNPVIDWAFMLGLLLIGLALILGVGVRIAAGSGAVLMLLMWASYLLPEQNPLIDYHVIYAIVLVCLATAGAGQSLGLGRWWSERIRTPALV